MRLPSRGRRSTEPNPLISAFAPDAEASAQAQPQATGGTLLSCRGVDVAYDKVQVLFGVDIDVQEGEIVALLGTNGAGKSTLLKAVSGLVHPVAGQITFDGLDITNASPGRTTELGIVQVPGGKAVFPTLTVAEHFKAGDWLYARQGSQEVAERTQKVIEMFPRIKERWNNLAGDLSGGEQQQLALGMAFVARPRLLVIDELSLGLAPVIVERLLESVRAIHAEGATVILVEQSVNVALTLASRAYFMEKGQVRFTGPTSDLLARDDVLRSVFLDRAHKSMAASSNGHGSANGRARTRARKTDPEQVAREPVLEVRGLTKSFGGINAVSDVSFTLHQHEILGLIGPNGAGKTTIFDLISGHLPAQSGRIILTGQDITEWPPDRRAGIGLGRSFQDAKIFPSLTVAENIAIGLERHIAVRDHVSALFGTPAMRESETDVAFTVDDLIDLMGLGAFRDKFVSELSTGSRRIVDLSMSIAHDPAVLILDEPSSGIAQRETEALGPLLRRIREEAGCALLVIEHDMPLITSLSDSIVALDLGRVLMQGTPQEVLSDERVIAAYLGNDPESINRSTMAATKKPRSSRAKAATR
jgi:ABC-type branched-subunit amino acid transport system ATPase component